MADLIESGEEDLAHLDGRWIPGIVIYVERLKARIAELEAR